LKKEDIIVVIYNNCKMIVIKWNSLHSQSRLLVGLLMMRPLQVY
jgi:hypothetical protein